MRKRLTYIVGIFGILEQGFEEFRLPAMPEYGVGDFCSKLGFFFIPQNFIREEADGLEN